MTRGSLDDLAAFACVARLRSFTRAAAALDTSTSNLSHTIRRLETRLGVQLLQRNSRSVSLSAAGEALLATLDPALESIDGALDALQRGSDSVSGTLRLTATRQAYDMIIRPVLPAFTEAHPDATVEVLIDYAFRDIVADRFDAGIRLGEKIERDMIAVKVGPDLRMSVVATPAYLARHGTPLHPHELTRHRCINYRMVTAGTIYAWEFERDGSRLEVRAPGPLTFNDPDLMLECALDGLGIAYVLEREAAPYVEAGRLKRILPDWTPPFPGFFVYYASRRQMRPVLAAFLAAVRKASSASSIPPHRLRT
ncbi:LysR family transcriptional regulator [Burkholderia sp. MSMB2157WGS]|uniref:LysR family transcriptional regulator n=1 Tax=Burkholderia sp. MSMB2157WGS TaxID=1637928 RepID=UPI00075DB02F|nr:LysR family transcriptional regulator [Burkholderia sp. MSMB2157WGS]KWE61686.1 LysR family transcriptional regulator [Burkholderia sp. MSMB2157WGS]